MLRRSAGQGSYIAAKDTFADLVAGGVVVHIQTERCLPLTRVRAISASGVQRLSHAFAKGKQAPGMSQGHSSGGGLPTVVHLTSESPPELLEAATASLKLERHLDDEQAQEVFEEEGDWYGVVDGAHRLAALQHLASKNPEEFAGYKWYALKVPHAPLQRLKSFARDRNEKQRKEHIVSFTLYDMLQNLRDVAATLIGNTTDLTEICRRRKEKGFATEVADAYSGAPGTGTDTNRQLAGIALKLNDEVIQCMGKILNGEYPVLARSHYFRTKRSSNSREDPIIDNRVYCKIINSNTIRGAKTFTAGRGVTDTDRVNALYRAQYYSSMHGFKGLPPQKLNECTSAAVLSRKEAEKMEYVLGTSQWPPQMFPTKNNLLRTDKFDVELHRNDGNDNELIPSLVQIYKRHYPVVAGQRLRALKERHHRTDARQNQHSVNDETPKDGGDRPIPPPPEILSEQADEQELPAFEASIRDSAENAAATPRSDVMNSSGVTRRSQRIMQNGNPSDFEEDEAHPQGPAGSLEQLNISCHQMKWQEYQRSVMTTENEFDMILADPPYNISSAASGAGSEYDQYLDTKDMETFVEFARRALVPGGCCFIFTSLQLFTKWMAALLCAGFAVMPYAFTVVKDSKTMQRSRRSRCPQNAVENGVVGWTPGTHPQGFKTDFTSEYTLINCTHARKFNVIDNVPVPRRKLRYKGKRKFVRVEEKSTLLISELLQTFSPDGGRILDPFAGTMTTAVACMAKKRHCTVIEPDIECYRLAVERLEGIATTMTKRRTRSRRSAGEAHEIEDDVLKLLLESGAAVGSDVELSEEEGSDQEYGEQQMDDSGNEQDCDGTGDGHGEHEQ